MQKLQITVDGQEFDVEIRLIPGESHKYLVVVDDEEVPVYLPALSDMDGLEWLVIDGKPYELLFDQDLHWVQSFAGRLAIEIHDHRAPVARPVSGDGRVKAPIPGLITAIAVQVGDTVTAGQRLLVLEAMKMENEILAPRAGTVTQVSVHQGKSVVLDELIIEIE